MPRLDSVVVEPGGAGEQQLPTVRTVGLPGDAKMALLFGGDSATGAAGGY